MSLVLKLSISDSAEMESFLYSPSAAVWCICTLACYLTLRTIYRLQFHPLHKIPGPRLAAATHLVEFYYDVVKGGKYIWEVERMHEKYGLYSPHPQLSWRC
jgi:hypothetical protein